MAGFTGKEEFNSEKIIAEIKAALEKQQSGSSEIARTIARKYGVPKKEVYDLVLKARSQMSETR